MLRVRFAITFRRQISLLLALILSCAGSGHANQLLKQTDTTRVELVVPVAFATDRSRSEERSFQAWFGKQSIDDPDSLSYGIIEKSTVIRDFPKSLLPRPDYQNGSEQPLDSDSSNGSAECRGKERVSNHEITSLFQELRRKNKTGRIVVYVHGCCMSFAASAGEAASLSAWIQQPVVMYDWGSPPASYAGSLVSYPRSQARFNAFIERVGREFPDCQISLVGFSLGAQLITDFLLQGSNDSRQIADVVLAKPDVDLIAFKSHLDKLFTRAARIHILAARNDWALALSGALRRLSSPSFDSTRLGAAEAALAGKSSIKILEISQLGINHVLPCSVIAEILKFGGNPLDSERYLFKDLANGLVEVSWR
jgi:esterase/lipase superfamily enzyme